MLNLSLASSSMGRLTIQNPNKQDLHQFHFQLFPTFLFDTTNKSSFLSFSNKSYKSLSLKCRHSDYFEAQPQQQQQRFSPNDSSFSSQQGRFLLLLLVLLSWEILCHVFPSFLGRNFEARLKRFELVKWVFEGHFVSSSFLLRLSSAFTRLFNVSWDFCSIAVGCGFSPGAAFPLPPTPKFAAISCM